MISKLISPSLPSGAVPAKPGDLFSYSIKTPSHGEIVMLTATGSGVVIHSNNPAYPLGHVYPSFKTDDLAWQRIPEATIAYTS